MLAAGLLLVRAGRRERAGDVYWREAMLGIKATSATSQMVACRSDTAMIPTQRAKMRRGGEGRVATAGMTRIEADSR